MSYLPILRSALRRWNGVLAIPLAAILLAVLCPSYATAAAAACGQSAATELSADAQAILSLNQALFTARGQTAQIAGAPAVLSRSGDSASLQQRAALVHQLMHTHPDEVRSVMLPPALASSLLAADPSIANLLEHAAGAEGDLAAVQMDDFDRGTAQKIYVLHDPFSATHLALYPTGSLRLQALLHRNVSVTGIQLGTDLLAETVAPLDLAGLQRDPLRQPAIRAAAVPASNTTLTCSTTGQQRTAVLLLQFPNNTPAFPGSYGTAAWWQQAITGGGNSVNSLWSEMTAGGTYATVDVFGPLTLPQTYGCADYLAMRSAALSLASNTIDLSRYTRIVLGFPASTCAYGGLADIGCNEADNIVPHPYSVVWMPIVTTYTANTGVWASLTHELGHNLGLNHANTLDFGTMSLGPIDFQSTHPGVVGGGGAGTATGAVTAVDTEYGDKFSVMGNPWSTGPGPYSAEHRAHLLGWIPASGSGNGLGTVTSAGTYTIQPASAAAAGTPLRALRILRDPASSSWIWLEYRNGGTPFDAANLAAVRGQNVSQGAVVHYENGYGDHEKTYELDMTPTGTGNNFADGALTPGTLWSDPYSPLSLRVNSITSAGLNVSVQYDSNCATFTAAPSPIAAAGSSGTIAVNAPATCTWKASSNAAWMSIGGPASGTGNGSFTWNATANTGVGQRATYFSVGRNSQRVVQLGSGANVVGLSPANPYVDPGSSIVLSLTLQDSAGAADLQTVELDATAAGAPPCTVVATISSGQASFFLLDPLSNQFTSGIAAGSGSQTTSGCTLTGSGSGLSVSGSTYVLTMNLAFPSAMPGVRSLFASANYGTELPVGLLNVGSVTAPQTTTNPPSSTQRSTTTTLTGVPASALPAVAVNLTATVSFSGAAPAPTGSVTFFDGASALGSAALNSSGVANVTATLAIGSHSITAVYGGDANFSASNSAAASIAIAQAASTTSLTASATQVGVGGSATLTVAVGHAQGVPTPTGTVTLRDGTTPLTTAPLNNASASFPISGLLAGTHTYTVSYSGDSAYLPSTSNAVTITVGRAAAMLTVSGPATVLAGALTQISVSVAGSGAVPTGTVLLQEGTATLGTVTLNAGNGTLNFAALSAGAHAITATYSGDANYAPGSSTVVALNVIDFALTASGSSIAVNAGATTGNTATLTLAPGSTGFPVNVTLTCSGAPAGATCTVSPGAVTPGSSTVPVAITVTTTARPAVRPALVFASMLLLPLAGLVRRDRANATLRLAAMLLLGIVLSASLTGCGSGASGATGSTPSSPATPTTIGTPAGTSTLTVQAVATSNGATLTHTATVTLQVN